MELETLVHELMRADAGVLMKAVGAWLGFVIAVPLYLAFVLALIVVGFGAMYHLWRDVCSGRETPAMPADALTA